MPYRLAHTMALLYNYHYKYNYLSWPPFVCYASYTKLNSRKIYFSRTRIYLIVLWTTITVMCGLIVFRTTGRQKKLRGKYNLMSLHVHKQYICNWYCFVHLPAKSYISVYLVFTYSLKGLYYVYSSFILFFTEIDMV